MQIAVVIPTLDEAPRIAETVRGVGAGGAGPREPIEVIVADGGSRDDTLERARAAGARVVRAAPGRAAQLAAGLAATAAEAVVFLHADTRLPSGWPDAVRRALARPGAVGGAFGFRFSREPDGRLSPSLALVELGARLRSSWLRLPYGDQAIFARRAALTAVGGVPQAPIMEDLDLVWALRRAGGFVLLREAVETSPRRYVEGGVLSTMLRNWIAAAAWTAGADRRRIARWYRRGGAPRAAASREPVRASVREPGGR